MRLAVARVWLNLESFNKDLKMFYFPTRTERSGV